MHACMYLCTYVCIYSGISPDAQNWGPYTIVGNAEEQDAAVILNAANNGDPRFGRSYNGESSRGFGGGVDGLGLVYLTGTFTGTLMAPPLPDLNGNGGEPAFILVIAGDAGGMNPLEVRGAGEQGPLGHCGVLPTHHANRCTQTGQVHLRQEQISRRACGHHAQGQVCWGGVGVLVGCFLWLHVHVLTQHAPHPHHVAGLSSPTPT